MSIEVLLAYKRAGETYEGELRSRGEVTYLFENVTYAQMIGYLHSVLVALPEDVTLTMQRTDTAGMPSITIDSASRDLVRTDPTRFIQSTSIAPRVVDLRKGGRTSKLAERYEVPKGPLITSGHAALAAAFGEVVYLSVRHYNVENPITGRWAPVTSLAVGHNLAIQETLLDETGKGWVTVRTEDLLRLTTAAGFYLPRAWNDNGPWISQELLATRFDNYNKEKSQCSKMANETTP